MQQCDKGGERDPVSSSKSLLYFAAPVQLTHTRHPALLPPVSYETPCAAPASCTQRQTTSVAQLRPRCWTAPSCHAHVPLRFKMVVGIHLVVGLIALTLGVLRLNGMKWA